MCFTVQLSKIGFALPFVSNSFAIISCCFLLVKKFFQLFLKLFLTFRLISVNFDILSQLTLYCQELFSFLFSTVFVSCNSDIIAFISVFVNYLLTFFYIFKNVNIKFDIFSCFYCFAVLHNMQPILLYIFTFRQRNSKAATSASLSRPLFPFLCKLLYLFLE